MNTPLSLAELRLTQNLAAANHGEGLTTIVMSGRFVQVCDLLIALHVLAQHYASECGECAGTGLVTIHIPGNEGVPEVDYDDQPCQECAFIREVLAKVST